MARFNLDFISLMTVHAILVHVAIANPVKHASPNTSTIGEPLYGTFFNSLRQVYYPPNAVCQEYLVPVTLDYSRLPFNAAHWTDDYSLIDFLSKATTRAGAGYPSPFGDTVQEKGTYNIAASFCTPNNGTAKAKTVILATHGIGPGREHWNSPWQPEKYNFVQHATQQGYSIFFYDRLGCGASDKISGYDAQLNTAVSVLQSLSQIVRGGSVTGKIGKPNKVVLIGFSFGSYTTHNAIAASPEIADAVVLTGIGLNATGINGNGLVRSFEPRIAALQNPALFGDRDTGYLTWRDEEAQIWNYFSAPNYDHQTSTFAEAAKQPFSISEFLTFANFAPDASGFTKPVLHITGETDYIVCDGYCPGLYTEPSSTIYRGAKPLQLTLHPGASHNINFHYNATGAYGVITKFLDENLK